MIIGLFILGLPGIFGIIALLVSIFYSTEGNINNIGPICDICGKPLRNHGMYRCESYC